MLYKFDLGHKAEETSKNLSCAKDDGAVDHTVKWSARGVMAIVVGIGHGDTSSNPRRDWLHFTQH